MPSGIAIANEVSKYFKKGTTQPSAADNQGEGDSDTATAHAAVNQDLQGQICPDCHNVVKGVMVKAFGEPANEANGGEVTRDQVDQANLNSKPAVNPLTAIRDPNGIHSM